MPKKKRSESPPIGDPEPLELMGVTESDEPPKAPKKRRAPRKRAPSRKAAPVDDSCCDRPPEPYVKKKRAPRKKATPRKALTPKPTGTADFVWDQRYQGY